MSGAAQPLSHVPPASATAAAPAPVPVTFSNPSGARLFGILHRPERPREPGTAILLLSPGVKMRVAPHRLYNKMAARFVALGYPVLRFDFHGLGDSEGDAPEALLADFYGATQMGRYVGDTIAAMDWLQQRHGFDRFIVGGLCGGALTGLLAATRDVRIVSLLGLSIPVIVDGSQVDASRFMTDQQLEGTRAAYLDKLKIWRGDAWRSIIRLATFQTDFKLLRRSIGRPLAKRFQRAGRTDARGVTERSADNTNPLFAPALIQMLAASRPVLLVFAEADRLYWEFQTKFMTPHGGAVDPYRSWCEIHVTPHANHIFSFAEWQLDMLDVCCSWLERMSEGEARAYPRS
jgi:uncharacterized protein